MTEFNNVLPPGKVPGILLAELLHRLPIPGSRILIGPGMGRDSAAIQIGDSVMVVKSDPITFPTDRAAHHLIHINANDIACQGATPRWLLVTALLPHGTTTPATVAKLFTELQESAAEIGVELIGGHTEITLGLDRPLLVGTMIGETSVDRLVDPARAQPGDRLLMTKCAGIEGTAILATELRSALVDGHGVCVETIEAATKMIEFPGISILKEAMVLSTGNFASALHDPTEGGIASAVWELASAAGCGALISRDSIAVAPETQAISDALGIDPLGLLASGSLLAAIPAQLLQAAELALTSAGIPWAWIGKLTPAETGIRLRSGSAVQDLPEFTVDEVARILAG